MTITEAAVSPARTHTITAREYLRVSKDDSKTARSPKEQHDAHVRAAGAQGWDLGNPYGEPDARSASRYAQREREGFKQLVTDLEDGTFGADILILWSTSRGSRRAGEWLDLLDLLAERQVKVYITADDTIFDPTKDRDWKTLADDAVDAEYQTRKSSADIKRALHANADNGRPHGKALLGYVREYDPKTGELLGQVIDPEVAPRIRDMFARLGRGESIKSIMRLWDEAGYKNGVGNPYSHSFITRLARNPQYAGFRLHEAGRKGGQLPSDKARLIEAAWEPIVDRETFYAVQNILNAPGRRTNREGRAKHWLTMIAKCATCEGPTVARKLHGKRWYYACHDGHVAVPRDGVDEFVEGVVVNYLEQEHVAEDAATLEQDDAELQRVRGEVATLERRLEELVAEVASGAMSPSMGGKIEMQINEQIESAKAKERELTTPAMLSGLFETGPGAAARWDKLVKDDANGLDRRRKIAAAVLVPDILGEVRLRPADFYRQPADERVAWHRTEETAS